MHALTARITKGLNTGAYLESCDNSGAKVLKFIAVKGGHTKKGRQPSAGIGDLILASVKKGKPDMRKEVVLAVVVRQRMPFRRPDGTRVFFADNAAVVVKDEKGNPKGTLIKGAIAKEIAGRWPAVAKLGSIIV